MKIIHLFLWNSVWRRSIFKDEGLTLNDVDVAAVNIRKILGEVKCIGRDLEKPGI